VVGTQTVTKPFGAQWVLYEPTVLLFTSLHFVQRLFGVLVVRTSDAINDGYSPEQHQAVVLGNADTLYSLQLE